MTELPYFLAKVLENPDDDAPRLVMADYLEENDYPEMGQFIRHQIRVARMEMDDPNYPAELSKMYRCGFLDGTPRIPFFDHVPEEGIRIGFRRGLIEHLEVDLFPTNLQPKWGDMPVRSLSTRCSMGSTPSAERIAVYYPFLKAAAINFFHESDVSYEGLTCQGLFRKNGYFTKLEHLELELNEVATINSGFIPELTLPMLRSFCLDTRSLQRWANFRERHRSDEPPLWEKCDENLYRRVLPNAPLEEFFWMTHEDSDDWSIDDIRVWKGPSIQSILSLPQARKLKRLAMVSTMNTHGRGMRVIPCARWTAPVPTSFDQLDIHPECIESLPQSTLEQIRHLKMYEAELMFRNPVHFPNLESISLFSGQEYGNPRTEEDFARILRASPRHISTDLPLEHIMGCDYSKVLTLNIQGNYDEDWDVIFGNEWPELRHLRVRFWDERLVDRFLTFKGMPNLVTLSTGNYEISKSALKRLVSKKNMPYFSFLDEGAPWRNNRYQHGQFIVHNKKLVQLRKDIDYGPIDPVTRFRRQFGFS